MTTNISGSTEPATAERRLVDELRADARTLPSLLLAYGRLFTPAPWPDGGSPPGEPGRCYVESASWAWASDGELAYVEGWAWDGALPPHTIRWPTPGAPVRTAPRVT